MPAAISSNFPLISIFNSIKIISLLNMFTGWRFILQVSKIFVKSYTLFFSELFSELISPVFIFSYYAMKIYWNKSGLQVFSGQAMSCFPSLNLATISGSLSDCIEVFREGGLSPPNNLRYWGNPGICTSDNHSADMVQHSYRDNIIIFPYGEGKLTTSLIEETFQSQRYQSHHSPAWKVLDR